MSGPGGATFLTLKGSGPPTFRAPETTLYWDEDDKVAYINADGNTDWDTLGSGGGGGGLEHDTAFPLTFPAGDLFLREDEEIIYENTGTSLSPNWTAVMDIPAAIAVANAYTDTKVGIEQAARTSADAAIISSLNAETSTRSVEDLTFLKKDGSRPLTSDWNEGGFKIRNVANAVSSYDAVNLGQLDAAIAGAVALLGTYEYCRAHLATDLSVDVSPQTFVASVNDTITDPDIHSISANLDRFVAQQDALYLCRARFKVRGWGGCGIQWYKNGILVDEGIHPEFRPAVGSDITFINDTLIVSLEEGDYITAKVYGLVEPDAGQILADSSMQFFCLASNAAGGGDLKSDGTVPMAADFNNGGNRQINMEDGVADTDAATVGQVSVLVSAAVANALSATLSNAVSNAVSTALGNHPPILAREWRTKKDGNLSTTSVGGTILISSLALSSIQIKGGTDFYIRFFGIYDSDGFGATVEINHAIYVDGVQVWAAETVNHHVGSGDDHFWRERVNIDIALNMTELGLSEGAHTIEIAHWHNTNRDAQLYATGQVFPLFMIEYEPAP